MWRDRIPKVEHYTIRAGITLSDPRKILSGTALNMKKIRQKRRWRRRMVRSRGKEGGRKLKRRIEQKKKEDQRTRKYYLQSSIDQKISFHII